MKQYTKFTEKYGKGVKYQEIDISTISEYDQYLLTSELVEILTEEGISSYGNGLIWTLNPNDYVDWLNDWLTFEDRSVPFMRSAFGDVLFIRAGNIMVLNSYTTKISLMTDDLEEFINRYLTDTWFLTTFFNSDNSSKLENNKIGINECYALTTQSVANMKEYLTEQSQMKTIQFYEH